MLRAVLLAFVLLLSMAAAAQQSMDYIVDRDTPEWFKKSFLDFSEDAAEAAAENKRVMIYFGQDGCPYCKKLHDLNYRQTEIVTKMRNHLDSIALNIYGDLDTVWVDGNEYSEKELAERLSIQFTPTLLFLDEQGREILRLAGYQPPKKFKIALQYVIDKEEQEPFADYLRRMSPPTPTNTTAATYPQKFVTLPYDFIHAGKPTAVLISQPQCTACNEWRDFLQSETAVLWRQARDVLEVNLYGKQEVMHGMGEAAWVAKQHVAFVPTLIFFNAEGQEEFRIDGYLRDFHLDSVFDYVVSGAYLQQPEFQRFLQKRADTLREQGVEVKLW